MAFGQTGQQKIDSLQQKLQDEISEPDRVKILYSLGRLYESRSLDSALLYAKAALSVSDDIPDSLLVQIENLHGTINVNKGQYNHAIQHFLNGLRIAESLDLSNFRIIFLVNLGALYDRQQDFVKAEEYYQRAINYIQELVKKEEVAHKSLYLANIYNNLANVYGNRGDTTRMLEFYDNGLVQATAANQKPITSIILNNIGNTQLHQGDLQEGYANIKRALALKVELKDVKGLAQCYRNLGYYFEQTNNADSAIYYFEKSIENAKKVGSLKEIVDAREGLARMYQEQGNLSRALSEYKQFKELNDSLYNQNRIREISRIENKFEFDKQQAALEAQRKKEELQFYVLISVLSGLAIILVLLILYQRSRIKRSKLKNEHLVLQQKSWELEKKNLNMTLEHKNKEMTTKMLYFFKKNELVENVISQLTELVNNLKSENKPIVRKVIKNLGGVLNEDSWQEFEVRFNEIHEEFYETLAKDYPELTPNERKLCAFLKLNMTSKEISSLTGQSIRSIDVARTRLRKKLDLTNSETNLVDFFASIG